LSTPLINAPAARTPLVAASNPLRKQTLLGIAPVIPESSEPVAMPPSLGESAAAPAANLVATQSPRRSQTLLGIAPVVRQPAAPAAQPAAETMATQAPAAEGIEAETAAVAEALTAQAPSGNVASSVSSIVTPSVAATDAPTTSDVHDDPFKKADVRRAAALSNSHDDLPELKPKRARWPLLLGLAAVLALGVVGLRQLDHAPTPVPPELARPVNAAKPIAKAPNAVPKSDEDDDDDGNVPNTGTDTRPDPLPPEPEPVDVKAKPEDAKPSASGAELPGAASTVGTVNKKGDVTPGQVVHIKITSDPPGARLFWKGKEQGTTPFVLEFPAGERHSYELGLPGYTVRKLVIDGTKTDISIGMRPDPAASSGAKPRK
jgi:hypothetical protein